MRDKLQPRKITWRASFTMSNPQQLVSKLWNYCYILRDDGLSYGEYVEQLTYLLFGSLAPARSGFALSLREIRLGLPSASALKMAHQYE
jgi:hypothetical protein